MPPPELLKRVHRVLAIAVGAGLFAGLLAREGRAERPAAIAAPPAGTVRSDRAGAVRLLDATGPTDRVAVAASDAGFHVLAGLNGEMLARVVFLESLDGGRSWSAPLELAREPGAVRSLHLASTPSGLFAMWDVENWGNAALWSRQRVRPGGEWLERRVLPTSQRPPAIAMTGEAVVRAVVTPPVSKAGPPFVPGSSRGNGSESGEELRYVEFDPVTGAELLRSRGPVLASTGTRVLEQHLVECGPGAMWIGSVRTPGEVKQLLWSYSARPELGRWGRPVPLESRGRRARHFGVLGSSGGRAILAFEGRREARILASRDGLTMSEIELEPDVRRRSFAPALAPAPGGVLLGLVRIGRRGDRLSLFSSSEAGPWTLVRSVPAPPEVPEQLFLAVSGSTAAVFFSGPSGALSVLRVELR